MEVGFLGAKNLRTALTPTRAMVIAVVSLALLDLITTVIWVQSGKAVEVNPIMAAVLESGIFVFVAVKLSTVISYFAIMEYYARRSAATARCLSAITLTLYITVYMVCFWIVNWQYFFR